jgi:hypothetical protein
LSAFDTDSEAETEQEIDPIRKSNTVISSTPKANSSAVVTVHNEK